MASLRLKCTLCGYMGPSGLRPQQKYAEFLGEIYRTAIMKNQMGNEMETWGIQGLCKDDSR